jgi:large subunit ribosomal protein L10e
MVKLIKGVAWRRLERPYTRKSKYKKKAFVKVSPYNKIAKYTMGVQGDYGYSCTLHSTSSLQVRHNAIESARKTSNKVLENKIGKTGYFFRLRIFPHHVIRNNPLATGAGADRMSQGLAHSFGKSIGLAAQVIRGHPIMEIQCNKAHISVAQLALKRASYKIPCGCTIQVVERNKPVISKKPAVSKKPAAK